MHFQITDVYNINLHKFWKAELQASFCECQCGTPCAATTCPCSCYLLAHLVGNWHQSGPNPLQSLSNTFLQFFWVLSQACVQFYSKSHQFLLHITTVLGLQVVRHETQVLLVGSTFWVLFICCMDGISSLLTCISFRPSIRLRGNSLQQTSSLALTIM